MIQDNGTAGAGKRSDGLERLVERLAGDESAGKAVPCSQAPDPAGDGFLGGEPEDQIAQRIRGRIRLFGSGSV